VLLNLVSIPLGETRSAVIIVTGEAVRDCLPLPEQVVHPERRVTMGEKGGKKDKEKAKKQKQAQIEKKKQEQQNKLPAKKPV
jgi:hypothetical protein